MSDSLNCFKCGKQLKLAKMQIDIGTGGKTYIDCSCWKTKGENG